jgi:hypothetical protein
MKDQNKTLYKKLHRVISIEAEKHKSDWESLDHEKINFIVNLCIKYGKCFEYNPLIIFSSLEKQRKYSFVNYYQEANFPDLKEVLIFEDEKEMMGKMQPKEGFRCPHCRGISKHPYKCDSGIKLELINSEGKKEKCNWKSFGLFGTLGEGVRFTIKKDWINKPFIDECFMPIAMESENG